MPSISITKPPSNSTVGRTFTASGNYDTASLARGALVEAPMNEVRCTLYDSKGGTIEEETDPLPVPPPATGTWEVEFDVDQDYESCSIVAELVLGAPPYASAEATGITITAG